MQSEQLAYAIVTPYSMQKSRTGGIVGRLISRTGLDLVGGRMFAPGAELTKRYANTIVTETDPSHRPPHRDAVFGERGEDLAAVRQGVELNEHVHLWASEE